MKNIKTYLDETFPSICLLGDNLFANAELGYKEFKTKEIILEFLNNHNITIDQTFAHTGFSISIGSGKPHIGLIAELDGIRTPGHPCASQIDGTAHACGHSTQVANMVQVMTILHQMNLSQGKVTLFFTPAEEYTDLEYRKQLRIEKFDN